MPAPERKPLGPSAGSFALFLTLLWSGNAIAIKAGLNYAPPLRLGWMRMLAGALVIGAWAWHTKADLRVTRRERAPLFWLGVLFAVQLAFMNLGIKFTTAGHFAVLQVTYPIWVALLSHFVIAGDRIVPTRLFGILVAYAGVVVISADSLGAGGNAATLLGDGLSLISGFLLGVRLVYSARLSEGIDPNKLLLTQAAFGTAAFVPAGIVFEPEPWMWTWALAASVAYQGLVIAGFGYIGNLWLLQRYLPSQVAVISLTQPMFAILLAWGILGEPPTALLWLGGVLVMMGAGLAQRRGRRPAGAPPRAATAGRPAAAPNGDSG